MKSDRLLKFFAVDAICKVVFGVEKLQRDVARLDKRMILVIGRSIVCEG